MNGPSLSSALLQAGCYKVKDNRSKFKLDYQTMLFVNNIFILNCFPKSYIFVSMRYLLISKTSIILLVIICPVFGLFAKNHEIFINFSFKYFRTLRISELVNCSWGLYDCYSRMLTKGSVAYTGCCYKYM